jgi:RNA pol II promoter Fmp27 protein domain
LDVRRTVSPVKTYSKPTIEINTSLPTAISWGTSYQPVIQDMMMTIEGFTKPEIDPSDRVGFWDKIRMSFHSRLTVNWKGDGDLQLRLKGMCPKFLQKSSF